jgi:hypothetical protein
MTRKNDFTPIIIFMYSPKRDKALNTSKKEIKNGGIGNSPNPPKN